MEAGGTPGATKGGPLRVVSIRETPEAQVSALVTLEADILALLEDFTEAHGDMPAMAVLGVLRLVEHSFLERLG